MVPEINDVLYESGDFLIFDETGTKTLFRMWDREASLCTQCSLFS